MRILIIHSDYLKYNVKNKTSMAEEISESQKNGLFNESLVVFTAVEKKDEINPKGIVKNLVKEIIKTNDQVKAENIVLYPSFIAFLEISGGVIEGSDKITGTILSKIIGPTSARIMTLECFVNFPQIC